MNIKNIMKQGISNKFIHELYNFVRVYVDIHSDNIKEFVEFRALLEKKLNDINELSEKDKQSILNNPDSIYLQITGTKWSTLMNHTQSGQKLFKKLFTN